MEWAFPEEIALYASIAFAYNEDGSELPCNPYVTGGLWKWASGQIGNNDGPL